jgi:hypothetical protein
VGYTKLQPRNFSSSCRNICMLMCFWWWDFTFYCLFQHWLLGMLAQVSWEKRFFMSNGVRSEEKNAIWLLLMKSWQGRVKPQSIVWGTLLLGNWAYRLIH